MDEKKLNHIIVLEPVNKTSADLLQTIESKKQANILRVSSADEAYQLLQQYAPCIYISAIVSNNDIPKQVTLLKKMEKLLKAGLIKSMLVSAVKSRQLGNLITGLGVSDYMEEPIPLRTMQFKANLQLKALDTIKKQVELKKASQEKIVFKKSTSQNANSEAEGAEAGNELQKTPALELDEDTFLFKNTKPKKFGKKTVVELEGPSPETGEWVEHDDKGEGKSNWRWVPEEKKGTAEDKAGDGWVHEGDKPTYQEESKKWQFVSEKPSLSLRKNGKQIGEKVSTDAKGNLKIAEDSPKATENLQKNEVKALKKKQERVLKEKSTFSANKEDQEEKTHNHKTSEEISSKDAPANGLKEKINSEKKEKKSRTSEELIAKEEQIDAQYNVGDLSQEEPLGEFNDKTSSKEESPPEEARLKEKKKKEKLSPLEFLQKKKAEQEQEQQKKEKSISNEALASDPLEEVTEAQSAAIDEDKTPQEKKQTLKKDKLQALKEKLNGVDDTKSAALQKNLNIFEKDQSEKTESSTVNPQNKQHSDENDPKEDASLAKEPLPKEERQKKKKDPLVTEKKERHKKELLKEIQEEMSKQLPERVSEEEKKKLRKELNLPETDATPPKELVKRAKLKKLKALREKLLELDEATDGSSDSSIEPKIHDLNHEEENTSSLQAIQLDSARSKRRAFDSDLSEVDEEDTERNKAQKKGHEAKSLVTNAQKSFYLKEEEILPLHGAWESANPYYVYLSGEIHYHGFDRMESLLPLWIFHGGKVPELLTKSKEWHFLGSLPIQAKVLKEIPEEVREYLLALKEGLKKKNKQQENTEELETSKQSSSKETLQKQKAEANIEENDATEITAAAVGNLETNDAIENDTEKSLESAANEDQSSQHKSQLEEQENSEDGSFVKEKSKASSTKLEELKSRLNKEEDTSIEEAVEEQKTNTASLDPEGIEAVSKNLATESEAVQSFFERRKQKKKSKEAVSNPKKEGSSQKHAFLGIFVSLSDALSPAIRKNKAISNVLSAIERSIPNSFTAIVSPENNGEKSPILHAANTENAVQEVSLGEGTAYPIASKAGEPNKILGYLFIKVIAPKKWLEPEEVSTLERVALMLGPVLSRKNDISDSGNEEKGVAA